MKPNKDLLDKLYLLWEKHPEVNFFTFLYRHTNWGLLDYTAENWHTDEDSYLLEQLNRELEKHQTIDLNLI